MKIEQALASKTDVDEAVFVEAAQPDPHASEPLYQFYCLRLLRAVSTVPLTLRAILPDNRRMCLLRSLDPEFCLSRYKKICEPLADARF